MGCLLPAIVAVGGCETQETICRWTEQQAFRTDETVHLAPPALRGPVLNRDEPEPCLVLEHKRFVSYRLHQMETDVEAVRHVSLVPGLIADNGWPMSWMHRSLETIKARQGRYIARLKAGESIIMDEVDERASFRREVGNVRLGTVDMQEELTPVLAADLPVRFQVEGRTVATCRTDRQGRARPILARTLSEALGLKPFLMTAEAEWEGRWVIIGTVPFSENQVAAVVRRVQSESMGIRGMPEGIPFARVTFVVPRCQVGLGDTCELQLTVTNLGNGPFYGLMGTTCATLATLNGLNFRFGMVPPGTTLTLRQSVRVPVDEVPSQVLVRIEWSEHNQQTPDPVEERIFVALGDKGQK